MVDNLHPAGLRVEDTSRSCENCGSYVTKQFIRVFGSRDGKVYACGNCATGRELRDGGGAEP